MAGLTVWPNPASAAAGVRVTLPGETDAVRLLDATGRLVRLVRAGGGEAVALSTAGRAPGVYVVRAGSATGQLVVE